MKRILNHFKSDRRYILLFVITLLSFEACFIFPNALPRLFRSVIDLITSILHYCFFIAGSGRNPIPPTVTDLGAWRIFPEVWEPIRLFPQTLAEFFDFWGRYFENVFTLDYFTKYLSFVYNLIFYLSRFAILFPILFVFFKICFRRIKNKQCTDRDLKSRQLIKFESFYKNRILKIKTWCMEFFLFCADHPHLLKVWILLWCLHFNVFTVAASALAYFFYFTSSWDIFSLYGQVLKLQADLTPVVRFIPGIIWFIVFYKLFNYWCESIGEKRINYAYRCNKSFLKQRGISTVLFGKMGTFKSQTEVSMAVTLEDMKFEEMSDTMFQYEQYFPNFPWQNLRDEIDYLIDRHLITEPLSCRKWISRRSKLFDLYMKRFTYDEYLEYLQSKYIGFPDLSFKYNYNVYTVYYNNGARIITLYEAIEEYACAYLVFTINSSLIFSNISIRSYSFLESNGNMPYRYSIALEKDPYVKYLNKKYAHIIDMDMIRRGKQLVKDNPKARTLLPGIYVMDEVDKERKNINELKDVKSSAEEANQKNDMYNVGVSVSRHSNLINFKSLVSFLGTLQRPDSLGAGTRQLGELAVIENKDELQPVLPFFSPFYFFDMIYQYLDPIWQSYCKTLEINRCDQTLTIYLLKNFMAKFANYHEKNVNSYGVRKLTIEIHDGLDEGKVTTDYWHQITRLEWSGLYVSDCLRGIFDPDVPNKMHVDDYECYSGIVATPEELNKQNSYFQNDIRKMKGE